MTEVTSDESGSDCLELTYPSDGDVRITLSGPGVLSRGDRELHVVLPAVLREIARDRSVRGRLPVPAGKVLS